MWTLDPRTIALSKLRTGNVRGTPCPWSGPPQVGFVAKAPQPMGSTIPQEGENLLLYLPDDKRICRCARLNQPRTLAYIAKKKKKCCPDLFAQHKSKALASRAAVRAMPFSDTGPCLETSLLRSCPKNFSGKRAGGHRNSTREMTAFKYIRRNPRKHTHTREYAPQQGSKKRPTVCVVQVRVFMPTSKAQLRESPFRP